MSRTDSYTLTVRSDAKVSKGRHEDLDSALRQLERIVRERAGLPEESTEE